MKPRTDGRVSITTRFPPETHERLKVAAEERGVSVNWLVTKAIEWWLPQLIPADELKWTRDRD